MHLEKNRTYACTFPVQRKEINVVKVHFTMRYSSRKLSNDKVLTTTCNFWRQIACSFQVMSGNILFLGNKIYEIPPLFQTRPGDLGKKVQACSLRFSALNFWNDSWVHFSQFNHNYNKIVKSDWLSTALISALIGQFDRTVCLSLIHIWRCRRRG